MNRIMGLTIPCLLTLVGGVQGQQPGRVALDDTCATFKRLWEGEIGGDLRTFSVSTPSPDGRYVSGVAWPTGDLAVLDLETGEPRRVTHKTASWNQDASFPWTSVFSADGNRLAYMWYVPGKGFEVRQIGVDGSSARTVFDPPRPCYPRCRLEDWSQDGAWLLALIGSDDVSREVGHQETWQLLLISVDDGSHRVLKTFDHRAPQLVSFSPDGRWVTYDRQSDRETGDWDVYTLPVDGGEEIQLLGGPEDDRLMGWFPDGGSILFYSDRGSSGGIWTLPVENGRTAGSPSLVRGDLWRVWPLGFSRDAYFFGVVTEEPQVRTAAFDFQAGGVVGTAEPFADPAAGRTSDPAWSPDGRYLAYKLQRHPFLAYESHRGGARDRLVIRSLSGEEIREIDVPLPEWGRIRWTPGGEAVMLAGRDAERNLGIFRLNLADEQLLPIHLREEGSDEELGSYALSSDGRTVFFTRWGLGTEPNELIALDATTGQRRVLMTRPRGGADPHPSPDGQWLAFITWSSTEADSVALTVVPAVGGEARELYRALPGGIRPEILAWSSDSKRLMFVTWDAAPDNSVLWTISPLGGPAEMVRELGCFFCEGKEDAEPLGSTGLFEWQLHPDGRRVAGVSLPARGEIWTIANLVGETCRQAGGSSPPINGTVKQ